MGHYRAQTGYEYFFANNVFGVVLLILMENLLKPPGLAEQEIFLLFIQRVTFWVVKSINVNSCF